MTNGAFSWTIESASYFNCVFFACFSNVVQMISYNTLVVFSLERAYVVLFPLRARGDSRAKFFFVMLVLSCVFSIGVNAPFPFAYKLGMAPGNNVYSCFVNPDHPELFVIVYLFTAMFMFFLPTLLLLVTNLAIIAGLIRATNIRRQLTVCDNDRSRRSTGESSSSYIGSSATATLLLVSLFQSVIYIPYSAVVIAYTLMTIGIIPAPGVVTSTNLLFSYFFFMDATVYTRVVNVFVYYLRIPFFRSSVNAVFCWCCGKLTSTRPCLLGCFKDQI